MVAREQAMADLQQKIKHAEEEEARRKKEHDKKVQKQIFFANSTLLLCPGLLAIIRALIG
jgi:hypothetical protein